MRSLGAPPAVGTGRERGAALVVVLWVVAVVALLAGAFSLAVSLEAKRTLSQIRAAEVRALLDAGIARAVAGLVDGRPERRWFPDGRAYKFSEGEASLTLRVWEETGRVDLNRAPEAALARVFEAIAGPAGRDAARAVVTRRTSGAAWASVLELGPATGVPNDVAARLRSVVTVHNSLETGGISALAAAEGVLAAWPGVGAADAARLVAARARPDRPPPEEMVRRLAPLGVAFEPTPVPVVTVRIEVAGREEARASAEAVLWIAVDGPHAYRVLEWREPAPPLDTSLPAMDRTP